MLIPLGQSLAKYNLHPTGVIHVGSHYAEEYEDYKKCGIAEMVFIEPCKEAFDEMYRRIKDDKVVLIKCACGSEEGEFEMHVSNDNQGQSNSLLAPKLHLQQHPNVRFTEKETVRVMKLDNLIPDEYRDLYDMLVMDVQGFEGEVLKGADETLKRMKIVYSEVNSDQTYQGNMLIGDMDLMLGNYGFKRVETHWPSPSWTWGDAIWLKR